MFFAQIGRWRQFYPKTGNGPDRTRPPLCSALAGPAENVVLGTLDQGEAAERAIVDIVKLREYCLNPVPPRGRHKARVFASALGLHQQDAEFLKVLLLEAALVGVADSGGADEYGQRYSLDLECVKGTRRALVRSAWIVLKGEDSPRVFDLLCTSE